MGKLPDLGGVFVVLFIVAGIVGWGVIEFALWLFGFVSVIYLHSPVDL